MKNLYEFQEFGEFLLESEKMKMLGGELGDDGKTIEITVEEEQVVGKKWFGLVDKKKKVHTVYRKSRGYEWHSMSSGKGVSYEKRKQLNAWADELKADHADKSKEKAEKKDKKK